MLKHPTNVVLLMNAAGRLDELQHAAVDEHVFGCARCRDFVGAMEHISGVLLNGGSPSALAPAPNQENGSYSPGRVGRSLAEFVAELFLILDSEKLPMLERMFAEAKEAAEIDGELGMKWHAEIGLAAARIALLEHEAIDS